MMLLCGFTPQTSLLLKTGIQIPDTTAVCHLKRLSHGMKNIQVNLLQI